jgi:MerR family transcriptional regulator, light-induced transcriptional regulator
LKPFLSPIELATALGVSQSSIKRWTDDGAITAVKTSGGHRRIALAEAVRFARASGLTIADPEFLGVSELPKLSPRFESLRSAGESLYELLHAGAAQESRALILSLYLSGHSIAAIGDGPIRTALDDLGQLWHKTPEGIFFEHRATQICLQAIAQLRLLLKPNDKCPLAMGGAPSGDTYQLPSLLIAALLESEGFAVTNLGPEMPFGALKSALGALRPHLLWISVSSCHDEAALSQELRELVEQALGAGVAVALGGRALPACPWAERRRVLVGSTLAELVAFVRGVAL